MKRQTITKPIKPSLDWEAARQRIKALKAELVMESEPPLEALERVWAEHAQHLAKALVKEQSGKRINLVFVKLNEEAYALEVDYVFDIRPAEQITLVPHVPDWVYGVYNLRGHILSVIDLSRFLGLPQITDQEKDPSLASLVVVKTTEMECAFWVDQVLAVIGLPVSKIQTPSELVRGLQADYVHGLVEVEGDDGFFTAIILNIQTILADERLIINQETV